jgi:hypothetical protein
LTTQGVPTRVADLMVEHAGNDLLVYNPADDTAHAVNASAAAVFEACDGTRSIDEIVTVVDGTSETPVDHEIVALAIADLLEAGLITVSGPIAEVSRRSLIVKLGAGAAAAAALPVVESIAAPSPAAASSRRRGPSPSSHPTPGTTPAPTPGTTPAPTPGPTPAPTPAPTPGPTPAPTPGPTPAPTPAPAGCEKCEDPTLFRIKAECDDNSTDDNPDDDTWEWVTGVGANDCITDPATFDLQTPGSNRGVITGSCESATFTLTDPDCWIVSAAHKAGQACLNGSIAADCQSATFTANPQAISHVELIVACCPTPPD